MPRHAHVQWRPPHLAALPRTEVALGWVLRGFNHYIARISVLRAVVSVEVWGVSVGTLQGAGTQTASCTETVSTLWPMLLSGRFTLVVGLATRQWRIQSKLVTSMEKGSCTCQLSICTSMHRLCSLQMVHMFAPSIADIISNIFTTQSLHRLHRLVRLFLTVNCTRR